MDLRISIKESEEEKKIPLDMSLSIQVTLWSHRENELKRAIFIRRC
jgi:hypothetical protein